MHIDLKVPYTRSIIQHQSDGTILNIDVSLTCMKILDPSMDWFKIFQVPCFNLYEYAAGTVNTWINYLPGYPNI